MESNWAVEHLQVIRTLMERSAIYRRALAPIMLFLGALGFLAAGIGWFWPIQTGQPFVWFWLGVSLFGISGAYWMVRRQAVREFEPFWSPPTRRVTQAFLPPLFAGSVATLLILGSSQGESLWIWWLPPAWMIFYGCALHSAGFFMPRGMKLFGWGFIIAGSLFAAWLALSEHTYPIIYAHLVMGGFFGGFHLAYGIYLHFTEPRKNGA